MAGDYNLTNFRVFVNNSKTINRTLVETMLLIGLEQISHNPKSCGTFLDLVLTNADSIIVKCTDSNVISCNAHHSALDIKITVE